MSIIVELTDREWQEVQQRRDSERQRALFGAPKAEYGQCSICGDIAHQTSQHAMYQAQVGGI